ncbi:MAG: DUF4345 family protein [Pseudomonadota bacterium]
MDMTFQILVGMASAFLLGLGLMSMFAPRKMVGNFAVEPLGTPGLSSIRSVFGGLFLACVGMLVFGLMSGQTLAFVAVAIVMGAVAFGRIVGIVADGADKAVVPPLIVELVIAGVLVAAYLQPAAV